MTVPDNVMLFDAQSNIARIDSVYQALRTSVRPLDVGVAGTGGHFSVNAQTGTMAAAIASAAQVFQIRYAGTGLFVLKALKVQATCLTGFAATSVGCPLQLFIGHGSSANGSGGTALAPSGTSNRARSTMGATAFATAGEIRVATTAALTAATSQTLEPAPIGGCMGAPPTTNTQSTEMFLFNLSDDSDHPVILGAGDTLAVCTLNPSATGTWVATFTMKWAELAAY